MNIYKLKKGPIKGVLLGDKRRGKLYVAVPQLKAEQGYCVSFGNKIMPLAGKEPTMRKKFEDLWGRKPYYLYYYEWKPKKLTIGDIYG